MSYTPAQLNTNNAKSLIDDSKDQSNNPIVTGTPNRDTSLDKSGGETLAAYNLRVTPGKQPVQPSPTLSYLGKPL